MSLLIDKVMLDQGYVYFNGFIGERRRFEVIERRSDGYFLVRDPWEDMLHHWAITSDEIETERAQGHTTPIPWLRTFHG